MCDVFYFDIYGMPLWAVIYSFFVMLFAGVVRGFSGFGMSLFAVPLLTLFFEPTEIIPVMYVLSIIGGLQLLPKVKGNVDKESTVRLLIGAVIGTPLGVYLLTHLTADTIRVIIGFTVALAVVGLWKGFKLKKMPAENTVLGVGLLSGILNGSTSMDGPPVIIYFLSLPSSHVAGRASLILFFLICAVGTLIMTAFTGIVTVKTFVLSGMIFPALMFGNWFGDRCFERSGADTYRKIALLILACIAIVAIGKPLMDLL